MNQISVDLVVSDVPIRFFASFFMSPYIPPLSSERGSAELHRGEFHLHATPWCHRSGREAREACFIWSFGDLMMSLGQENEKLVVSVFLIGSALMVFCFSCGWYFFDT